MKLFGGRQTRGFVTSAGTTLGGISTDAVQMNVIFKLNNSISQLEKMVLFKPNAEALKNTIQILIACKSQINRVIQPSVATSLKVEPDVSSNTTEGPSFHRRP